jgi:hypothetical protein
MEKKEVSAGSPITVAGVTLIPVEEVSINGWHGEGGVLFFGVKRPVGLVLLAPPVKKAFRVNGEEVPLDQLIREVPGIKQILG